MCASKPAFVKSGHNYACEHPIIPELFFQKCLPICDRIWENVHSLHIRFCTFKGSYHMIGKTSGSKVFWTNKGILALQSLQVSCLSDMHNIFKVEKVDV